MSADTRRVLRTRLLALVVLVATFVAGALVGIASREVIDADERTGSTEPRGRGDRDLFGPEGTLTRRLELTADQRVEIERMLAADRAKTDSIFREIRPRLRARYDSTTAGVRGILTPAQQVEFDRYRAERRERMRIRYRDKDDRRDDEGS